MRIAMTLLVRDEVDIVETWLRYHLARGIDVVIATDHRSVDGTSDVLREYERQGRVVVLREEGHDVRQSEWMSRMSRLAARDHGADWVVPSDADEFWWPRSGSFHEVLGSVPRRFGVVRGLLRNFVLRPGDARPLERLVVRTRAAPDLASQYHAQVKVAHRAVTDAVVGIGNHDVDGAGLALIREWFPFEVMHFPLRTVEQLEDKFRRRPTTGQHTERAVALLAEDRLEVLLAEALVDDAALDAGLGSGALVADTRLRDAMRALDAEGVLPPPTPPTIDDDADLAQDAEIVLGRDSATIAERRCGELERAVAILEERPLVVRAARRLTGLRGVGR